MNTDTVELYKTKRLLGIRAQWRWRYVRSNGRILADSAESYMNFTDMIGSLATVLGVTRDELLDTQAVGGRVTSARVVRTNGRPLYVIVKR